MGRRNRERIARIQAGTELSIVGKRDKFMRIVKKLAAQKYIESTDTDKWIIDDMWDRNARIVCDVLPDALDQAGRSVFSVADLTRRKDQHDLIGFNVQSVLALNGDRFVKHDNKADLFSLRKRKGRARTGVYKACAWCGHIIYVPKSQPKRQYHSRQCYALARKSGEHIRS